MRHILSWTLFGLIMGAITTGVWPCRDRRDGIATLLAASLAPSWERCSGVGWEGSTDFTRPLER
jgi:hypothetical protein